MCNGRRTGNLAGRATNQNERYIHSTSHMQEYEFQMNVGLLNILYFLSFAEAGLIGFARLCPGDQYEVRRFNPTSCCWTSYCCYTLKGIVHTKIIVLSAFTHPHMSARCYFLVKMNDGALMVSQTDKKAP